jgi:hypothetical protein
MRLITSIKKIYYNHKFSKALKYIEKRDLDKAVVILKKIEYSHPEALTELMRLDFEKAISSKNIDVFRKAIDNRNQVTQITNQQSLNCILGKIETAIINIINRNWQNEKFRDAYAYAELLTYINPDEVHNQNIFGEIKLGYAISIIKNDIHKSKKLLIELFQNKSNYNKEINNKVESEMLSLADRFSKQPDFSNSNDLCKLLLNKNKQALNLYLNNWVLNIKDAELNQKELSLFYLKLNSLTDEEIVLSYYEKIIYSSDSASKEYVDYISKLSARYSDNIDKAISILDRALEHLESKVLINYKIELIQKYSTIENDKKICLLQPLIGKHENVEPLIAQIYLDFSDRESVLDKKKYWIKKAFSYKDNNSKIFNESLYRDIFKQILQDINALAIKFSKIGYYEDSYDLLSMVYRYSTSSIPIQNYSKIKILESQNLSSHSSKFNLLKNALKFVEETSQKHLKSEFTPEIILSEIISLTKEEVAKTKDHNKKEGLLSETYILISGYQNKTTTIDEKLEEIKRVAVHFLEEKGKSLEINNDIESALQIYKHIKETYGYNLNVDVRSFLCLLKMSSAISIEVCLQIEVLLNNETSKDIRDLAYRYALHLLKSEKDKNKAKDIIDKHLPRTKESLLIRQYCKNEIIKSVLVELDKFNSKLMRMNENKLTIDEAQELLTNLSKYDKNIGNELPDLRGKFIAQEINIQSYILRKLYEAEEYLKILDYFLTTNSKLHVSNDILHNSAVVGFGVVQTGKLNLKNYKRIISLWITAVYQDVLFVNSLDYTSWDDQYEFTLFDSLGKLDKNAVIPKNVNFDDPTNGSISIGEVQKNLLSDFKNMLCDSNLYNNSQIDEFERFYDSEIEAISDLFSLNLGESCFCATPYYTELNKDVFTSLSQSLENEFSYSEEEVDYEMILEVGLKYGIKTKRYIDYQLAKETYLRLISVLESLNSTSVANQFTSNNISVIRKHPQIYNRFTIQLKSLLENHIKENVSYDDLYNTYIIVANKISNDNIWFILINFILNRNVEKVNSNTLGYYDALSQLFEIYKLYSNHQRLCDNMVILCDMLIEGDIMSDGVSSYKAKELLNKIIGNRNTIFRASARKLGIKYNEIINQLDPINKLLMTGLSNYGIGGVSLNAQGLAIKEGLSYYKKISM